MTEVIGIIVLNIPRAKPPMITVAGPVRACSANFLVVDRDLVLKRLRAVKRFFYQIMPHRNGYAFDEHLN